MKAKLRGNQCWTCEKTHEECAGSTCVKADISDYVCRIFGVRPIRKRKRR
ncbi:hypothetical protein SEA_CLUBPENGUIN_51 [Streptomyces phage ClubPenguin]|nr:hypothetical protein SEA_CLUBPENGUIN_51 [Streptomyces phage ClubPenguin]